MSSFIRRMFKPSTAPPTAPPTTSPTASPTASHAIQQVSDTLANGNNAIMDIIQCIIESGKDNSGFPNGVSIDMSMLELSTLLIPQDNYVKCCNNISVRLEDINKIFQSGRMSEPRYNAWVSALNVQQELIDQAWLILIEQQLHSIP
jgi:hypothetical protein